ncbi:MAG: RNA polymerase sporulation sigma factor SigE [Oscillospiraceae bacterium]|nr:RNA polymerase sporulation sigma factor SigE [Oscillospiraceae bacterium]
MRRFPYSSRFFRFRVRLRLRLLALFRRLGLGLPEPVHYVSGSDSLPPPLDTEAEKLALEALAEGDPQARQTLIEHNLRLVVYIARRFENTGVGLEDLVSIGAIGLIKAISTFRADRNIKLATYASRCIENEIMMYLRKRSAHRGEVSIDEPLNTDWDGNELVLGDVLGTDGDEIFRPLEEDVERQTLLEAVDSLEERERTIIVLRFGLLGHRELTQKEVADKMGISQSYISRLEKRIIQRLRHEMARRM